MHLLLVLDGEVGYLPVLLLGLDLERADLLLVRVLHLPVLHLEVVDRRADLLQLHELLVDLEVVVLLVLQAVRRRLLRHLHKLVPDGLEQLVDLAVVSRGAHGGYSSGLGRWCVCYTPKYVSSIHPYVFIVRELCVKSLKLFVCCRGASCRVMWGRGTASGGRARGVAGWRLCALDLGGSGGGFGGSWGKVAWRGREIARGEGRARESRSEGEVGGR